MKAALAALVQLPSARVFPSAYSANLGLLGSLFTIREWWWLYALGIWLYMCIIPVVEASDAPQVLDCSFGAYVLLGSRLSAGTAQQVLEI